MITPFFTLGQSIAAAFLFLNYDFWLFQGLFISCKDHSYSINLLSLVICTKLVLAQLARYGPTLNSWISTRNSKYCTYSGFNSFVQLMTADNWSVWLFYLVRRYIDCLVCSRTFIALNIFNVISLYNELV
jgi:hypothetical protein